MHEDALTWLQSLSRFGVKPGLERTRRVLVALGNPERALSFFHVAGTNGKGSVCAFLTSLLSTYHKVGTFTSPAFDGYRGRFVVAGETIPDDVFAELAEEVRRANDRVNPGDSITEFEALTAMALLYFQRMAVDVVVWETGLGGRFDATNVVHPAVTAITNVSLDHVEILGPTIHAIARDKSGIIKSGAPIITAARDDAYLVIEQAARHVEAPLYRYGETFHVVREEVQLNAQRMTYRGIDSDVYGVPVGLFGAHQCENAAVALAMLEVAVKQGACKRLSPAEIRVAMANAIWPGRFEIRRLSDGTWFILDGAHNPEGAARFASALDEFCDVVKCPKDAWVHIVGVLQDKDFYLMQQAVLPRAKIIIATAPASSRARSANTLAKAISGSGFDAPVLTADRVEDAVALAVERIGKLAASGVCCWGSLYTVDEARRAVEQLGNTSMVRGR